MTPGLRTDHRATATVILLASLLSAIVPLPPAAAASGSNESSSRRSESAQDEYLRLRAENAMLHAILGLGKQTEPYLILDVPAHEMRLELQGVSLIRVPIQRVALNRLASGVSRDTTHIGFCEVPFVLQREQWFEPVKTLALKDSSAVMNRPDTTGTLAHQIQTADILSILHFDRNLVLALDGSIPPPSRIERWKKWFREFRDSFRPETPQGQLARERRRSVLLKLQMEPASVRTIAPNLTAGTKLVLRF